LPAGLRLQSLGLGGTGQRPGTPAGSESRSAPITPFPCFLVGSASSCPVYPDNPIKPRPDLRVFQPLSPYNLSPACTSAVARERTTILIGHRRGLWRPYYQACAWTTKSQVTFPRIARC